MLPILVLVSSWIWYNGPSSWVDSGCPGCLRRVFFMFNVIDKRDVVLDAADNDNRDDADKKSIDDWEDTFDVVEYDWDDSDTNKTMPSDRFSFFLTLWPWLTVPFFSRSPLWWGGSVFLCHSFINKWFLEMRMFDVACLVLFVTNRGELRKSSSINSYV